MVLIDFSNLLDGLQTAQPNKMFDSSMLCRSLACSVLMEQNLNDVILILLQDFLKKKIIIIFVSNFDRLTCNLSYHGVNYLLLTH